MPGGISSPPGNIPGFLTRARVLAGAKPRHGHCGSFGVTSLSWMVLWSAVAIVGIGGIVSSANRARFERRVDADVRKMLAAAGLVVPVHQVALQSLPHPVRRYLVKAVGARPSAVRHASLQQDGTFRPNLSGPWYALRATQHFTADPPGFIWHGRVRLAPGLWIDEMTAPLTASAACSSKLNRPSR